MSQPINSDAPTTGPTPNSMPGASPSATQPQDKPAAQPTTPAASTEPQNADETPATSPLTDDERSELARLRAVKTEERIWEKRAKENFDKATKYDEEQRAKLSKEEQAEIRDREKDTEIATLKENAAREKVSRTTGVPPELIVGKTEEEMQASAEVAAKWRGPVTPPVQSSAAPASSVTSTDKVEGPKQITSRDELAKMKPADRMQAFRDGRLKDLGAVPGPGDLRNLQHAQKAAAPQGK